MCYRMSEARVLVSAGVTESQNTAAAAAFLSLWWFVRFGSPHTLFDNSLTEPTPFLLVCDELFFKRAELLSRTCWQLDWWTGSGQLVLCAG